MEQCPNCGELIRLGAKFCTACRYELTNDVSQAVSAADGSEGNGEGDNGGAETTKTELTSGWPASPNQDEAAGWAPATAPEAASDGGAETATGNDAPINGESAWPTPASGPTDNPSDETQAEPVAEFWSSETPESAIDAAGATSPIPARARAGQLLDELRDILAAADPQPHLDLSGVISDLEVAVTPPGALAADDLAELRETLLQARERPRDLDTVIDMTKRIDSIVALIFAYDRAIAAIERSLTVLRPEVSSPEIKKSPSFGSTGEGLG